MPRIRPWPRSRYTRFPRKLAEYAAAGPDVCWEWEGAVNAKGYAACGGQTVLDRKGRRLSTLAYKRAYQLLVGDVPDGMQLDHICRNKRCINPFHLEVVTGAENMRRSMPFRAPTAKVYVCKHGHSLTGENRAVDKHGWARCRICRTAYDKSRNVGGPIGRPRWTHCAKGHPISGDTPQERACKVCGREHTARWQRKRKEQQQDHANCLR